VAAGVLLFRANDGRDAIVPYVPGSGPGVWIPTPPGFLAAQAPEVAYVRPFTLNSPVATSGREPPPDLSSDTWARDLQRDQESWSGGMRQRAHA